jgi:phosphoglycerate dehydrogenase-like enzyme
MLKAIYLLDSGSYDLIYGPQERQVIQRLVDVYAPPQTGQSIKENPGILAQAEVILSGWGMVEMNEAFMQTVPALKAVFYGAGSIRGIVTDAFWARGIPIVSAYSANAVPVVEFALAQIFFSLKRGWHYALTIKKEGKYPPRDNSVPGGNGSTVGLISLGMIGRSVAQRLGTFNVKVIAYDPFVSTADAAQLGVEMCSLEEVFRLADVVSLHTPWLKETVGMITGAHFSAMKPGACFINTARGAVVRETEMIQVLQQRTDLYAVLDVTYPEPPEPDSPLYTLPNVILTPHIAGAMGTECQRMGRLVADELTRYLQGEPLQWAISRERAAILA